MVDYFKYITSAWYLDGWFKQISHIDLIVLLATLKKRLPAGLTETSAFFMKLSTSTVF